MSAQRIVCLAFIAIVSVMDGVFFLQRCDQSPPVSLSMFAFTVVVQVIAIALTAVVTYEPPKHIFLLIKHPILWPSLLLIISSYPMAEESIKYSDKIGRVNWYKSTGLQCNAPTPAFK